MLTFVAGIVLLNCPTRLPFVYKVLLCLRLLFINTIFDCEQRFVSRLSCKNHSSLPISDCQKVLAPCTRLARVKSMSWACASIFSKKSLRWTAFLRTKVKSAWQFWTKSIQLHQQADESGALVDFPFLHIQWSSPFSDSTPCFLNHHRSLRHQSALLPSFLVPAAFLTCALAFPPWALCPSLRRPRRYRKDPAQRPPSCRPNPV